MSYDDPQDYQHYDRNEYDRELDRRDRQSDHAPASTVPYGPGTMRPDPIFPNDNDPED